MSPPSSLPSPPSSLAALVEVSDLILSQACHLLTFTIKGSKEIMTQDSVLLPGSSVGKHLRHIHDHFRIFISSLPPSFSGQVPQTIKINYDLRLATPEDRRRASMIEIDPIESLRSFEETRRKIEEAFGGWKKSEKGKNDDSDFDVVLEAVTPEKVEMKTSLERELWFACLHAIHHFSLIRVLLLSEHTPSSTNPNPHTTIDPSLLPEDLGVAPSTIVTRLEAKRQEVAEQEARKGQRQDNDSKGQSKEEFWDHHHITSVVDPTTATTKERKTKAKPDVVGLLRAKSKL